MKDREAAALARIARREEAAKRRQDAYAERARQRVERQIARTVQKTVNQQHRSTRIPAQPIPQPRGIGEHLSTWLLGSRTPKPVGAARPPSTTQPRKPAAGLRRVKTRTGWITLTKKAGAVTHTMRKSKNRMKRALGELLR